jgi:nucleoid-associated protein YgaU
MNVPAEPVQSPPAIPEKPQPPAEKTQPPAEKLQPVLTDKPPEPIPSPAPVPPIPAASVDPLPAEKPPTLTPAPAPAPAPVASTGPVLAEAPPKLETVPAIESAATRASTAGAIGWASVPSGGRRIVGSIPIISTPAEIQAETPRVADGPKFTDDAAVADQVEPVVHVVQPGENFFTISKQYYREGRFYRALHAANKKQVPDITVLYVGTVLRIPPPEALDRSLIDPPSRSGTNEPTTSTVSRTTASGTRRPEPAAEEVDLAMPSRRPRPIVADPEAPPPTPRRPTYKVKARETLRGIARDTLGDSTRYREIFNLNRDTLETLNTPLTEGMTLTLPADATVGRRASR